MEYDLKIVGGTVIDGTGAERERSDVGIRDGRITALGEARSEARAVIDASNRVVCPGFIDIHTHYDAQVLWDPLLSVSPWHGVTTAVIGNCGFGVAPTRPEHRDLILRTLENVEGMSIQALRTGLGQDWPFVSFSEYLDALERQGVAINVAAYVGHTPVRLFTMGEEAVLREARDDEIAEMCRIVREALEAGALGFASTQAGSHVGFDGRPVPSRLASEKEMHALAGTLAAADRGIIQMTVGAGDFLSRIADMARVSGRTVTWTALLAGLLGPGSHRALLQRSSEITASGLSVVPQVSCRPLCFECTFEAPFPLQTMPFFAELGAGSREDRKRAYADPTFRDAFRAVTEERPGYWKRATFTYVPGQENLLDRSVADVARERQSDPVDLVLDLSLEHDLRVRLSFALMNDDEEEVAELLHDPGTVVALSDAGAHMSQLCDACFTTHLLGHWVREKGELTLEQAVRMLTSRPAEVVGIRDRGLLAEGWPADLVVFDPDTVGPSSLRRVHDLPAGADRLIAEAHGIEAVVVNGELLRRHGAQVLDADVLPGRVLRHGTASPA